MTEYENNFLDLSIGTGSSGDLGETEVGLQVGHSRNFTLSPETTDCDSNCGDLDSEVSLMLMENELGPSSGLLGTETCSYKQKFVPGGLTEAIMPTYFSFIAS